MATEKATHATETKSGNPSRSKRQISLNAPRTQNEMPSLSVDTKQMARSSTYWKARLIDHPGAPQSRYTNGTIFGKCFYLRPGVSPNCLTRLAGKQIPTCR